MVISLVDAKQVVALLVEDTSLLKSVVSVSGPGS